MRAGPAAGPTDRQGTERTNLTNLTNSSEPNESTGSNHIRPGQISGRCL